MGLDTSRAVLPELEARFEGAPDRGGDAGLELAKIGKSLKLIRIRGNTLVEQRGFSLLRRRMDLHRMVRNGLLVMIGFLALFAVTLVYDAVHGGVGRSSSELLFFLSVGCLLILWDDRQRGASVKRRSLVLALGLVLISIGLVAASSQPIQFVISMASSVVGTLVALKVFKVNQRTLSTVNLSDGTSLPISKHDLPALAISWQPTDASLALHNLPGGRILRGADAEAALRKVLPFIAGPSLARQAGIDRAYALVRSTSGLHGLLSALEGKRRDDGGLVTLSELPKIYVIALDLALAEANSASAVDIALRRTMSRAQDLAREVESLD